MNSQAFERGFVKAALAAGVDWNTTVEMLKEAGSFDPAQMAASNIEGAGIEGGLLGAGIGAVGGGIAGHYLGRNKQDPSKDHSTAGTITGALAGAGIGGLGGAYHGANQSFHNEMQPMYDAYNADKSSWRGKAMHLLNPGAEALQDSEMKKLKDMSLLQALMQTLHH
jgi:hypothetical protein